MTTIALDELTPGKPKRIEVNGESVCVARIGDEVFAISDTCSHSDASLSEGDITGYKIECWLHGAEFDLQSGAVLTPPAVEAVESYEVIQDGQSVTIQSKK